MAQLTGICDAVMRSASPLPAPASSRGPTSQRRRLSISAAQAAPRSLPRRRARPAKPRKNRLTRLNHDAPLLSIAALDIAHERCWPTNVIVDPPQQLASRRLGVIALHTPRVGVLFKESGDDAFAVWPAKLGLVQPQLVQDVVRRMTPSTHRTGQPSSDPGVWLDMGCLERGRPISLLRFGSSAGSNTSDRRCPAQQQGRLRSRDGRFACEYGSRLVV